MKGSTMKKGVSVVVIAVMALILCACSKADKQVVDFAMLPQSAQTFVKTHFADKQVAIVYYDNDIFDKDYELYFNDGARIDFESNGEWKELEDKVNGLPMTALPAGISQYVTERHPGMPVVSIERKRHGFTVELSSEIEMKFDKGGQFLRYDD